MDDEKKILKESGPRLPPSTAKQRHVILRKGCGEDLSVIYISIVLASCRDDGVLLFPHLTLDWHRCREAGVVGIPPSPARGNRRG